MQRIPLSRITTATPVRGCLAQRNGKDYNVHQYTLTDGTTILGYEIDGEVQQVEMRIRKLTPYECLRLQGMEADHANLLCKHVTATTNKRGVTTEKPTLCKSVLYKLAGNSIPTNCLRLMYDIALRPSLYKPSLSIVDESTTKLRHLPITLTPIDTLSDYDTTRPLRLATLCSGYDSQLLALRSMPYVTTDLTFWSEFDPDSRTPLDRQPAVIAHNLLFPEYQHLNLGDMTRADFHPYADKVDFLTYSTPCQNISLAGKGAGIEEGSGTNSSILWNVEEAIRTLHPRYLLQENVKNLVGRKHRPNFDKWCKRVEQYGYLNLWTILNARTAGTPIPQNRERLFMLSIYCPDSPGTYRISIPTATLTDTLSDYLVPEAPEEHYLADPVVTDYLRTLL